MLWFILNIYIAHIDYNSNADRIIAVETFLFAISTIIYNENKNV